MAQTVSVFVFAFAAVHLNLVTGAQNLTHAINYSRWICEVTHWTIWVSQIKKGHASKGI